MFVFFFNDTATTEIYTLSLHDALPISVSAATNLSGPDLAGVTGSVRLDVLVAAQDGWSAVLSSGPAAAVDGGDRESTRLNSSHANISYAVFCFEKKNKSTDGHTLERAH